MQSFAHRHLASAQAFQKAYDGNTPLAAWLKQQFAQQKKFGSKDRRFISDALFAWFRSRWFFTGVSISKEEEWLTALFLFAKEQQHWADIYPPEWHTMTEVSFVQKCQLIGLAFQSHPLFQFISAAVSPEDYGRYLRHQPPVFLRLRPGRESLVRKALREKAIGFREIQDDFLALANGTDLGSALALNKDAVVQNLSSAQSILLLERSSLRSKTNLSIWDVCAASGGKSLVLRDYFNGKKWSLTVTDLRASILQNLQKRFAQAGLSGYRSQVADLSQFNPFPSEKFDLVVVDAPCSGSGTWASSPEMSVFFRAVEIDRYQQLQRKILVNAQYNVAVEGYLLYITCSVFAKENEDNVQWLLTHHPQFRLVESRYFHSPEWQSDFLFAALFTVSPL